jgi:hypothetical protein|eukprot:COSAG01_NODE_2327_length_7901_cov_9.554858_2_plen_95_part_00
MYSCTLDADSLARERRRGVVPRRRRVCGPQKVPGCSTRGDVGDRRGARIGGVVRASEYWRLWGLRHGSIHLRRDLLNKNVYMLADVSSGSVLEV